MCRIHSALRWLLALSASLLLLHALIYGPGRGITAIPPDHELTNALVAARLAGYSLFLAAAFVAGKSIRLAIVLLAIGLLCRSFLEIHTSITKQWFAEPPQHSPGWSLAIALFYFASFVLPALALFGGLRQLRSEQAKELGELHEVHD